MADFLGSNEEVTEMLMGARQLAQRLHHQFVMPEHMLSVMIEIPEMKDALNIFSVQPHEIPDALQKFFNEQELITDASESEIGMSQQSAQLMHMAFVDAYNSESNELHIYHYVGALFHMEESWVLTSCARPSMTTQLVSWPVLLMNIAMPTRPTGWTISIICLAMMSPPLCGIPIGMTL